MNKNITTFDNWAKIDKDEKMAKGHLPAVNYMLDSIKEKFDKNFDFIDIGCGNGWVIRKISKYNNASYLLGIDGAPNMINKALSYELGTFELSDIETYNFKQKFDVIFSMETFYYFKNINAVLKNIYLNGMKENAKIIIGIDHYKENKPSLSWDKDYDLELNTLSVKEWINKFKEHGFTNVQHSIFNPSSNWNGTLVISANK